MVVNGVKYTQYRTTLPEMLDTAQKRGQAIEVTNGNAESINKFMKNITPPTAKAEAAPSIGGADKKTASSKDVHNVKQAQLHGMGSP
jgi:hypothetical protein